MGLRVYDVKNTKTTHQIFLQKNWDAGLFESYNESEINHSKTLQFKGLEYILNSIHSFPLSLVISYVESH